MTRADHRTGTERIAEVAAHTEGEIFVNVQGDEPLLDPVAVDTAVNACGKSLRRRLRRWQW